MTFNVPYDPDTDTGQWKEYNEMASAASKTVLSDYKDRLKSLLLFATLYSAVVTAFLIESIKLLQPDEGESTKLILLTISKQLADSSTPAFSESPFKPPDFAPIANISFTLSLTLSLISSVAALLGLQWVDNYLFGLDISSTKRQFRDERLLRRRITSTMTWLPALIILSFASFCAGLFSWLLKVSLVAALITIGVEFIVTCALIVFLFGPNSASHPFRSPIWTFDGLFNLSSGNEIDAIRRDGDLPQRCALRLFQNVEINQDFPLTCAGFFADLDASSLPRNGRILNIYSALSDRIAIELGNRIAEKPLEEDTRVDLLRRARVLCEFLARILRADAGVMVRRSQLSSWYKLPFLLLHQPSLTVNGRTAAINALDAIKRAIGHYQLRHCVICEGKSKELKSLQNTRQNIHISENQWVKDYVFRTTECLMVRRPTIFTTIIGTEQPPIDEEAQQENHAAPIRVIARCDGNFSISGRGNISLKDLEELYSVSFEEGDRSSYTRSKYWLRPLYWRVYKREEFLRKEVIVGEGLAVDEWHDGILDFEADDDAAEAAHVLSEREGRRTD